MRAHLIRLDGNLGKKRYMIADVPSNFIIQHIAGPNPVSEVMAYEQVIVLERMFAAITKEGLLLNIMKLPMAIKENTFR